MALYEVTQNRLVQTMQCNTTSYNKTYSVLHIDMMLAIFAEIWFWKSVWLWVLRCGEVTQCLIHLCLEQSLRSSQGEWHCRDLGQGSELWTDDTVMHKLFGLAACIKFGVHYHCALHSVNSPWAISTSRDAHVENSLHKSTQGSRQDRWQKTSNKFKLPAVFKHSQMIGSVWRQLFCGSGSALCHLVGCNGGFWNFHTNLERFFRKRITSLSWKASHHILLACSLCRQDVRVNALTCPDIS